MENLIAILEWLGSIDLSDFDGSVEIVNGNILRLHADTKRDAHKGNGVICREVEKRQPSCNIDIQVWCLETGREWFGMMAGPNHQI